MDAKVLRPLQKLAAASVFIVLLVVLIGFAKNVYVVSVLILLILFVALPVLILYCIDAGRALRAAENVPTPIKLFAILLSLPQAIFGLISLVLGVAIVLWVAYNFLIERQPEFRGGVLPSLGIGPALIIAGYWWIRSAFKKSTHGKENSEVRS